TVPDWSGRGQTQDGFSIPSLYAPGRGIVSTLAPGSDFASLCPTCIASTDYIKASGTSMAAPVVAGAAADLLQLHPDWAPDQLKGAIVATAHRNKDGNNELDSNKATTATPTQLV